MDRHNLWIKNDHIARKLVLRYEVKRLILKSLKVNKYSMLASRYVAKFNLASLRKTNSPSSLKNRCIISGRSKAIDKNTSLARFNFRSKSYESTIPGLKRAS